METYIFIPFKNFEYTNSEEDKILIAKYNLGGGDTDNPTYESYFEKYYLPTTNNPFSGTNYLKYPSTHIDRHNFTQGTLSINIKRLQQTTIYANFTINQLYQLRNVIVRDGQQSTTTTPYYEFWFLKIRSISGNTITYDMELDMWMTIQYKLQFIQPDTNNPLDLPKRITVVRNTIDRWEKVPHNGNFNDTFIYPNYQVYDDRNGLLLIEEHKTNYVNTHLYSAKLQLVSEKASEYFGYMFLNSGTVSLNEKSKN